MDDKARHANFCGNGKTKMDKDKCGCIETDKFNQSASHIAKIIETCKELPLENEDIRTFISGMGIGTRHYVSADRWQLDGTLIRLYNRYKQPLDIFHTVYLNALCREFWLYTNPAVTRDPVDAGLNEKYREYDAQFTTIRSELKLFLSTYPLQKHRTAREPNPETKLQIQFLLQRLNSL
jgi:hypothetical protein